MKSEIKECKPFGMGGHIIMRKEDIEKNFLVLPESSKFIINGILEQYHESLEEITNPLLKEVLSKEEIAEIKQGYQKKISNIHRIQHKDVLKAGLDGLKDAKVEYVGTILNDLEEELPKKLRKKLIRLYYKSNKK